MKLIIPGLSLALLLGACTPSQPEKTVTVTEKTYTVKENLWYRPPQNPTQYIAQEYNRLSNMLPETQIWLHKVKKETETQTAGKETEKETISSTQIPEDVELPEIQATDADLSAQVMTCFLADFFTLANKTGTDDIGGLDFIPSESAQTFRDYAAYYYYSALPVIQVKYGKEALPEVTKVLLTGQKKTKAEYLDKTYDGYAFEADLEYAPSECASDFKTHVKCTIIKMEDVHYVDPSDVTAEEDAGQPMEVWRVIAVTD